MSQNFIEFILIALLCVALAGLVLFMAGMFIFRRLRNNKPVTPPLPQPPLASPPRADATVALPRCPQCHLPLTPNAKEGLCPACLAKVALDSEPPVPAATVNINPLAEAAPGTRVPPEPAQLAPHFPQLEILELLGMGGMGMVYKARQPRLDRIVALKILPVDSASHPSFAERFNREAKALAKLNHPGIVNVYDFGQTGPYYFFIMEFVDGMNLRELLNKEPITPRQALELVVQICTALQFAHDEGVVHRDIKPENILLNKKGQVKIADFGLAKLLGSEPDTALTMSQAAMGTMNYMAPEQRQNAQGVDHRADIYSLGVVFYEMLTGEVPMGRFEPPSKRVQVDVRLDEVVLRALEREPARRYQQVSEVKSNVETITSTAPSTPPVPPPAAALEKTAKSRPGSKAMGILTWLSIVPLILAVLAGAQGDRSTMILILASWGTILIVAIQLLSRQQIKHARERGLWPPLGELPHLAHVKRLAQAGEMILAIKLFRKIHPASLAEARAAVEKLSCPLPPTARHQSSTDEPPFSLMRAYGLLFAGWWVAKLLWNFRLPGCWLACIGMSALLMWISLRRMRIFPEQYAIYSNLPPSTRRGALAMNFFSLMLGFVLLTSALVTFWEQDPLHGNAIARSAAQYEAQYKGKEYHLLQGLGTFSPNIPNVEMVDTPFPIFDFGWGVDLWHEKPGHRLFIPFVYFLSGCFAIFLTPCSLIGEWHKYKSGIKLFSLSWLFSISLSWRSARAGLALGACVLGSALPIYLFNSLGTGFTISVQSFVLNTNAAAVTDVIEKWAAQNGYAISDILNRNLDTVPNGKTVASVRLEEAWKPSPFDRWQATLLTFRRISPYLAFEIISSEDPAQTRIMVSATGPKDKLIPEDLVSSLEKLAPPPPADGGKNPQATKDH